MKSFLKIFFISIGSLLILVLVALSVCAATVFSGKNIAPLLARQLNKQEIFGFQLDSAALVLWDTFPELSLHLVNLKITDNLSQSMVFSAGDIFAAVDLKAFLSSSNEELIVRKVSLDDVYADAGSIMLCIDRMNTGSDTPGTDGNAELALPFAIMTASDVSVKDADILYRSEDGLDAAIRKLSLTANLNASGQEAEGGFSADIHGFTFSINDTSYCRDLPLHAEMIFKSDLGSKALNIVESAFGFDSFRFSLTGDISMAEGGCISMNLNTKLKEWKVKELLALVPEVYRERIAGMSAEGNLSLDANAGGRLGNGYVPVITGKMLLEGSSFRSPSVPVDIGGCGLNMSFHADFNENGKTCLHVDTLYVSSGPNRLFASGSADDVFGKLEFDFDVGSCAELAGIIPYLPDSLGIRGNGRVELEAALRGNLAGIIEKGIRGGLDASGTASLSGIDMEYCDTVSFRADAMTVDIGMDSLALVIADAGLKAGNLVDANFSRMGLGLSLSVPDSAKTLFPASGTMALWSPRLSAELENGMVKSFFLPESLNISALDFSYADDTLALSKGGFAMGKSDFILSGTVTDISKAISGQGLVNADMDFDSEYSDIDELLSFFSGMGRDGDTSDDASAGDTATDEDIEGNPFMVPEGIRININTDIKKAVAYGNTIENIGGRVNINDGTAIIRQLGFTSDAARMQLTAMYKSPRKNHLFVGLDFHLMDIEIDKLIRMVPKIDSLVPMLKSFSGQAEFHLGLETNLNSRYELKKSTILGAASIEGKNLVVLDSDTFDKIAKMLKFRKSSKNIIDSLAVDMTVFRDEIDVYPFVVSMDNYKAILSGRHNLDMSFNYHVDCLSPIRLGLDVKGTLGNLKFGLTPTRYKNLFVPERRNDLQERTMNLMNLINSSLKSTVVETSE